MWSPCLSWGIVLKMYPSFHSFSFYHSLFCLINLLYKSIVPDIIPIFDLATSKNDLLSVYVVTFYFLEMFLHINDNIFVRYR